MMSLILFLIFALCVALLWFQGAWNNAITLINLLFSTMIATNYYEPICTYLESLGAQPFTYLLDFVVIWFLFAISFGIFRAITDTMSQTRVKFDMPVEMTVRSILALWSGWLILCFLCFTMHFAPFNDPQPLGAWSTQKNLSFIGLSPDSLWLSYMQNRSMNAFSRGHFSDAPLHPEDNDRKVEAFNVKQDWEAKQYKRRANYRDKLPDSMRS